MTFNYSDAWLLYAIKLTESEEEGATLTNIIMTADYVNHAILTYLEFSTGLKRLTSVGLVIEKNKQLRTSNQFKEWWKRKYEGRTRIVILKALDEIAIYLNENFMKNVTEAEVTTGFTEVDFNISVKEYQDMASEAIKNLGKKKSLD